MKRDPSLHITKSTLISILRDEMGNGRSSTKSASDLANIVFSRGKSRSVSHRGILVSNDKMEKKAKQIGNTKRYDADKFSEILYTVRKRYKHRGIILIKPGHPLWPTVKDITAKAISFCEDFDLNPRKGFIKYIEIGLKFLPKFNLYKLLSNHENICNTYEAMVEIEEDSDREMTNTMYKKYRAKILENTGLLDDSDKYPEKFVWFVRARKQCEDMNLAVGLYIKAQFDALDFTKGIPHPTQLVGQKARDRVIRYMYKKGIKLK